MINKLEMDNVLRLTIQNTLTLCKAASAAGGYYESFLTGDYVDMIMNMSRNGIALDYKKVILDDILRSE